MNYFALRGTISKLAGNKENYLNLQLFIIWYPEKK